jgi:hypothetical protein
MKRTDLIHKLEEEGCILVRHGGNHDWYRSLSQACLSLYPGIGTKGGGTQMLKGGLQTLQHSVRPLVR